MSNSLLILSYKYLYLYFVFKSQNFLHGPCSSSCWWLLSSIYSMSKIEANQEVATVAVGWNSCVHQAHQKWWLCVSSHLPHPTHITISPLCLHSNTPTLLPSLFSLKLHMHHWPFTIQHVYMWPYSLHHTYITGHTAYSMQTCIHTFYSIHQLPYICPSSSISSACWPRAVSGCCHRVRNHTCNMEDGAHSPWPSMFKNIQSSLVILRYV